MKKLSRTSKIILSPEARVFRQLRIKHALSMREAGKRLGCSDSYISQIENGRENIPRGERLMKFLNLYGDITEKYFKQLCKESSEEVDEVDQLIELVKKLSKEKVATLLTLAQQMAERKI